MKNKFLLPLTGLLFLFLVDSNDLIASPSPITHGFAYATTNALSTIVTYKALQKTGFDPTIQNNGYGSYVVLGNQNDNRSISTQSDAYAQKLKQNQDNKEKFLMAINTQHDIQHLYPYSIQIV